MKNDANVSLTLAVWLATDEYKPYKYDTEISSTSLIRSPRYILGNLRKSSPQLFEQNVIDALKIIHPDFGSNDIQDKAAARIGTAIHNSVEYAWINNYQTALKILGYSQEYIDNIVVNPETYDLTDDKTYVFLEKRSYKPINLLGKEFVISGQFDMVIDGELHDIKTTSVYSYISGVNDEKYILQGSIYRWLNPSLITGEYLTIDFVFTDWKKSSITNINYPPAKIISKRFKLLSLQEIEDYIINKLKILINYWNKPLEIIPCCSDKEKYSSQSVFKYYKNGFKEGNRSTKNFTSLEEALNFKRTKGNNIGDIIEDKGKPFLCPYCELINENDKVENHINPVELPQLLLG